MAESYSDDELADLFGRPPYTHHLVRTHATLARLAAERDKAEDAAGRLGEDLLVARRERDEARRVAKVLAGYVSHPELGPSLDPDEWTALQAALAYPEVKT